MGHGIKFVLACLFSLAKVCRALASDVSKDAPESPKAIPPGLKSDIDDRQLRIAQQRLRPLDATR
jgi:hypothetical protein